MVTLQPISHTATPEFVWAWQLYEEAFPAEERRTLEQQRSLLLDNQYAFCSLHLHQKWVGLMGLWQLAGFTFLEHFAVAAQERGKGVGQQALEAFLQNTDQPVVLEVEPRHTQVAASRIAFYQRAGFHLNTYPYLQPPYDPQKPWVPLQVMSFPGALDPSAFQGMVQELHRRVYGVPSNS